MAWTAPRTWVAAETVTAALLNTHLRDNLLVSEAVAVTTAEDLIRGDGANTLVRHAVETAGEWLQVLAGPVIGGAASNFAALAGLIIFYNGTSCPDGWTEVTAFRGRTVLGLPSGGTNAGTSGTALTDLQERSITTVVAHTHAVGTFTSSSDGVHTHTAPGGAGGATGLNADNSAGTITTSSDGAHTHTVSGTSASSGSASVAVTMPYIQYLACSKA